MQQSDTGGAVRRPHAVDLLVGRRLRLRRVFLGYSQDKIARALGLTFQQIQKYERGINRISASRLYELARLLDVPIAFFFEGAAEAMGQGDHAAPGPDAAAGPGLGEDAAPGRLAGPEIAQLVATFERITDAAVRKELLSLLKVLAGQK